MGKRGEISLLHKAQRYGWQALHVPPAHNKHRGGVAIMVKPPLALVELEHIATEKGQLLLAECHGLQEAFCWEWRTNTLVMSKFKPFSN